LRGKHDKNVASVLSLEAKSAGTLFGAAGLVPFFFANWPAKNPPSAFGERIWQSGLVSYLVALAVSLGS
jgi:hypothetical protein